MRLFLSRSTLPHRIIYHAAHPTNIPHLNIHTITRRIDIKRPTLDDVQRISEGRAATTRGWGSRQIPHRLNAEERQQYNIAKEKGFLTLKGSGYRKERKGAPLANIYRQLNDAMNTICILIEQGSGSTKDLVLIDVSTLRIVDGHSMEALKRKIEKHVLQNFPSTEADQISLIPKTRLSSPFTVLIPPEIMMIDGESNDEDSIGEMVDHIAVSPIWQQKPALIGFECKERQMAKLVAKFVSDLTIDMVQ